MAFPRGTSGNPAGRPKGSRNKFGETFVEAFAANFAQHGASVIDDVRKHYPVAYLRIAAALVPKKLVIASDERAGLVIDAIDGLNPVDANKVRGASGLPLSSGDDVAA